MKHFFSLLFLIFISSSASSQCTYVIDMQDSFGDGWNGGSLSVSINSTFFNSYTLSTGSVGQATFAANHLDIVEFTYTSGGFPTEVSYQISVGGAQLFADGQPVANQPSTGLAFTHQCGGCDPPGNITVSNVSTTTADVSWTASGGATNFIIEYGLQGFTPGTGTMVATTNNPHTLTGLSPSLNHDVYVAQICQPSGDTSIFAGPVNFATLCAPFMASYLEDVETIPLGNTIATNCWTETGTAYSWYVNSNGTGSGSTGPTGAYSGSRYFYTEASSGSTGSVAQLISPVIDLSSLNSPLLSFRYHMYGASIDRLIIDIYDGTTWVSNVDQIVGEQQTANGDPWLLKVVNLSAYTGLTNLQIRFRAIRGSSFTGDISIDDIEVKDAPNIAPVELIGIQPSYCNAAVNVDFVIANLSGNSETDVPWAIESNGAVISSGSIPVLAPNSNDTISLSLGGVGPAGANAMITAYTYYASDQTPADDTISQVLGMSYTGVNANLTNPVGCQGAANGMITTTAHSGVGMYTYFWSNGQTDADATALAAGTYMLTVTDSIGCTSVATLTLNDPPAFAIADTSMNLQCNNDFSGYASVTATGGVPGYSYLWSNGHNGWELTNASAGAYSVTVTDANGCESVSNFMLTEPTAVVAAIQDNGNGTATGSGAGGQAPYTYQWDPSTGNQTTATATGLTVGAVYYVVVTDATGCTAVMSFQATATGVDEISAINSLKLFPNPTSGNVFVELDLVEPTDVAVRITNVTGQTLSNHRIPQSLNKVELETANLPTGVYIVQFTIGTETLTKKLIVSK